MVHSNNSVANVSEMADEQQCNLSSLVVAELRNLGVRVPKLKKLRTKQASRRSGGGIFGMPLEQQDLAVSGQTGIPIPVFLKATTDYLLGSKCTDGLFRKAGSTSRQRELRRNVEDGLSLHGAQVHDVAAILKQWLRELPETVVPEHLNQLIMRCSQLSCEELQTEAFLLVCLLLPVEHLHVLQHILLFLSAVARESEVNHMNAHNLALVMAPNLLSCSCETAKKASYLLQKQTLFVELLICHAELVGHMPSLLPNTTLNERKKKGILHRIVPRSRAGTPLKVAEPSCVDVDCSPSSTRSELKRRASTGQREPNLGPSPRKKMKSPLASTQETSLCDRAVLERRHTKTQLGSPGGDKARKTPLHCYSTRSLNGTFENLGGKPAKASHGRRSLTSFVGGNSEEATTPKCRLPTPGTVVKSRSTLKRGRPNTIYTGLPLKPNSATLTPQVAKKNARCVKLVDPKSTLSTSAMFSLENVCPVETDAKASHSPENGNVSRVSSYVSIYESLGPCDQIEDLLQPSEAFDSKSHPKSSPLVTDLTQLVHISVSGENSSTQCGIVDNMETGLSECKQPSEAREREGPCVKNLLELIKAETWTTPLPSTNCGESDDFSRRESIVQIRKRNAGMVRENVRLFSQQSELFPTPSRPRKCAARLLRSNSSSGGLCRAASQRSPLQQTNRMGTCRKVAFKSEKNISNKILGDVPKEWVMDI